MKQEIDFIGIFASIEEYFPVFILVLAVALIIVFLVRKNFLKRSPGNRNRQQRKKLNWKKIFSSISKPFRYLLQKATSAKNTVGKKLKNFRMKVREYFKKIQEKKKKRSKEMKERFSQAYQNRMRFWWQLGTLAFLLAMVFLTYLFNAKEVMSYFDLGQYQDWFFTALCAIEVAVLAVSFKHVGAEEIGAIYFFGKALVELDRGYGLVLVVPTFQLLKDPGGIIQLQLPGEPENVFKGSDDEPLPSGLAPNGKEWVRPIRITTASPKTSEGADDSYKNEDLHQQMTMLANGIVKFRIKTGKYLFFKQNMGSIEKVSRLIRDDAEAVWSIEFAKMTPAMILKKRKEIDQKLKTKLEETFSVQPGEEDDTDSGVDILECVLLEPTFPKRVSEALANKTQATIDKQTTVTKSEGERDARKNQAKGDAEYERKVGEAKNEVLEKQLDIETGGDKTKAAEVTKAKAIRDSDITTFAPGGDGGASILVDNRGK